MKFEVGSAAAAAAEEESERSWYLRSEVEMPLVKSV